MAKQMQLFDVERYVVESAPFENPARPEYLAECQEPYTPDWVMTEAELLQTEYDAFMGYHEIEPAAQAQVAWPGLWNRGLRVVAIVMVILDIVLASSIN